MPLLFLLGLPPGAAPGARAFTGCASRTLSGAPASLPEEQEDPAVYGRDIYAAYNDASGLVVAASHDAGASWTRVTLDAAGILPRVIVGARRVYVAWVTGTAAKWSVEFAASDDGGNTFSGKTDLGRFSMSASPPGDQEIQMAVSGSLVAIVSKRSIDDMAVAVSNDRGRNFATTLLPTFGVAPEEEYVAAFGGDIAVVWNDIGSDGLYKILFARSTDGGQGFSPPQNLTPAGTVAVEPLLSVSPNTGTLYMIWHQADRAGDSRHGVLGKSSDFGASWATQMIDPGVKRARQFSVAAADPDVWVTYLEPGAFGDWRTRLRMSHDGAQNFGPPVVLGSTGLTGMLTDETHAPRLSAGGDLFSIVFDDEGSLYVRSSSDGGRDLAPALRLGRGSSALIARNTVLWLADDGSVAFARCR